jgi:very-short-patch-repair endonuclease
VTNGHISTAIARVAAENHGIFSREQALDMGCTRRQIDLLLKTNEWIRELPGIYRHAASPASDHGRHRAAVLWAGDGAVLSHRSAAWLWALDGCDAPEHPELTIAGPRNPKSDIVVVHRSLALAHRDTRTHEGFRVTNPVRTIIDLAGVAEGEPLEVALEDARRRRLVTDRRLRDELNRIGGRGRTGAAELRSLLAAIGGDVPSESALEVKVARLLRTSGLPPATRQHKVRLFGRRYRLDFAWPRVKVALECEGRAFHEFEARRTRWRALGVSGWRVIPVTWQDATLRWDEVVTQLEHVVGSAA